MHTVTWRKLLLGCLAAVIALIAFQSSAHAEADHVQQEEPPYSGCVLRDTDVRNNNGDHRVVTNGYPYWVCPRVGDWWNRPCPEVASLELLRILDIASGRTEPRGFGDLEKVSICGVEGESELIPCRNEEDGKDVGTFDIPVIDIVDLGEWSIPISWDIDPTGWVLVPAEWDKNGDLAWWVREIMFESEDTTYRRDNDMEGRPQDDRKNKDAKGCDLGAHPPVPPCSQVREEKVQITRYEAVLDEGLTDGTLELSAAERDGIRAFAGPLILSGTILNGEWEVSEFDANGRLDQDEKDQVRQTLVQLEEKKKALTGDQGIVPDDCWGTFPTSHYQITWKADAFSLERLIGWMATLAYGFAKASVSIALWLFSFAYIFDFSKFVPLFNDLAHAIDEEVVHFGSRNNGFTLFDIAWFSVFTFAGFNLLRRRLSRGLTNVLISLAAVALGSVFVVWNSESARYSDSNTVFSVSDYLSSYGELLDRSGAAPLMIVSNEWNINDDLYCDRLGTESGYDASSAGTDNTACSQAYRETNVRDILSGTLSSVHEEFVERTFMFINFNKEAMSNDPCFDAVTNTVSTAYHGHGWEQRYLDRVSAGLNPLTDQHGRVRNADCGVLSGMAAKNGEMGVDTFIRALFVGLVMVTVAVLVGMLAAGLLLVKFAGACMFAMLPIAVLFAVFPGRMRTLAWWWLGLLLQLWLASMALGLVLAFLVFGLNAVNSTMSNVPVAERWTIVLLLLVLLFHVRKHIIAGTESAARGVSNQLASLGEGAGGGGGVSWARPGSTALDLNRLSNLRTGSGVAGAPLAGMASNWAMTSTALTASGLARSIGVLGRGSSGALGFVARGGPRRGENRAARKTLNNLGANDVQKEGRGLSLRQIGRERVKTRKNDETAAKAEARSKAASRTDRRASEDAGKGMRVSKVYNQGTGSGVRHPIEQVTVRRRALAQAQGQFADANQRHQKLRTGFNDVTARLAEGQTINGAQRQAAQVFGLSKQDIEAWNSHEGRQGSRLARRLDAKVQENGRSMIEGAEQARAAAAKRNVVATKNYNEVKHSDPEYLRKREEARRMGKEGGVGVRGNVIRGRDRTHKERVAKQDQELAWFHQEEWADFRRWIKQTEQEPHGWRKRFQKRRVKYQRDQRGADEPVAPVARDDPNHPANRSRTVNEVIRDPRTPDKW